MRNRSLAYRPLRCLLPLMLCALLMGWGCAVGPDFVRPKPPPVTRYTREKQPGETVSADGQAQRFTAGSAIVEKWWRLFGSPEIDSVVEKAIAENPNLQAAVARLSQSRDALKAGYGVFFPKIGADIGAKQEKYTPYQFGGSENGPVKGSVFNLYSLGGTVSYLLDIWGGERRQVESLAAQTAYQRQTARAAYLTLVGNVINTYITEAAYQAQIEATERIAAFEKEQLQIANVQMTAGTTSYATVLTVQAQLEATQATLPSLEKNFSQARGLLTALVGETPQQWAPPRLDLARIVLPSEIPVTLPSQLVRRRPDILAAEAQLHSACADIGAATSALLPNLTLSGDFGWNNTTLDKFFGPDTNFWSFGADLSTPIFQGGTLWFQRRAAIQKYKAAFSDYKQTVIAAFQQVADGLHALEFDASALKSQSESLEIAERSLKLTAANYRAGLVNYLQVLIADNQCQQANLACIQAKALRLQDTTALIAALGGGWRGPQI